jgi:zinc protease
VYQQRITIRLRPVLAVAAALCLLPAVLQAAEKKYEKIKPTKLREVSIPPVQRVTLDNGLQLFVVEDHDLPLFRMSLVMKAGGAYDPADEWGLASITASVLRTGGSEVLPGDRMDEVLESMGGSIETNSDALTTSIGINVLIEDTDKALGILRDLLLHPAYPQEKVDLEIKQARSGIARRNDDPTAIADREMDKVLYGADHPLARQVEYAHLDRMKRDDLVSFHQKYYHPQDAYLAVWGDFSAADIIARLRTVLGEWPRAEVTYPQIPAVPLTISSVNLVVKESVNQSNLRIGHRGTTQKDPDYYALVVMNEILGGSFGSRLFNEVRSRQGLAYNVSSALGAGLSYPGMFRVRCGTKSESTVKAIRACIDEVRKMQSAAITPEELERAKAGILNSHVFNFTNKGDIVTRQMNYVRHGYPADFLEKFPKGIEAVTVEDVKRAAANYLQPDRLAVLAVGKPQDFDEPLAALGKVTTIDIAIPEPKVAEQYPAPTPETLARGKEILAAAAAATGGLANLNKVSCLTLQSSLTLTMMGQSIAGKLTRFAVYPKQSRSDIEIMGQKMVQVCDAGANTGFQSVGGRAKDLEPADLEEARDEMARDGIQYLRTAGDYAPQWIGEADVKGVKADVLLMTTPAGKSKFKVFVDQKSHLVVKHEYRGRSFQGAPVNEELFMEDYRKAGTLLMPHKLTILQDGQPFMSSEATSIGWEPIPPEKFRKES